MALDDDAAALRADSHEGDHSGVERCVQAARSRHLSALPDQTRTAAKRVLFQSYGGIVARGGDGGRRNDASFDSVHSYGPGNLLFSVILTNVGVRGICLLDFLL